MFLAQLYWRVFFDNSCASEFFFGGDGDKDAIGDESDGDDETPSDVEEPPDGAVTLTFSDPIPFSEYRGVGGCVESDLIYNGITTSIDLIEYGSFCINDTITRVDASGSEQAYKKIDVEFCANKGISNIVYNCEDSDCAVCETIPEGRAFGPWSNVDHLATDGHCENWTFGIEDESGSITDVIYVYHRYSDTATYGDDIRAYNSFFYDNSCIGKGQPPQGSGNETEGTSGDGASSAGSTSSSGSTSVLFHAIATALLAFQMTSF